MRPLRSGLLAVSAVSLAFGCDMLKKEAPDAAPPAATATATTPPATATATPTAAPTETTVAPLTPGATPPAQPGQPGHPVAKVDGGAVDAGKTAPAADGGTAPVPTPTFTIPTAFPGFDAGGFKPPPGFPTTLPTFPPPQPKK